MNGCCKVSFLALLCLLCTALIPIPVKAQSWSANWIWTSAQGPNNTWIQLRKKVTLNAKPTSAIARIAAENKYWLYINDVAVVMDGGLDVRPDLQNTYYDEIDLAPYLRSGENIIAVLVWHKGGGDAYTQRTVDYGGFLFEAKLAGTSTSQIVSDNTWKVRNNTAFTKGSYNYKYNVSGTIKFSNAAFGDPLPNITKYGYYRPVGSTGAFIQCANEDQSFALPGTCDVAFGSEDNQYKPAGDYKWVAWPVTYDARNEIAAWKTLAYNDGSWTAAVTKGIPPVSPWNNLVHRTIPFWKDYGLKPYQNQASLPATVNSNTTITGQLGINIQGTPYLKVNAPAGVRIRIVLNDFYWQDYVTKAGDQEFECFEWQNSSSHTVNYEFTNVTGTVTIQDLKFRQTSYNTDIIGSFSSNDNALNTLWTKSKNTSFVCMRDIFYDCPNRERGQWWGDVSEQILYSFYLYDQASSNLLTKKAFREFMRTQKPDGSLYTTAPGIAFHLPDQNIAAVSMLWKYYQYTGDATLLNEVYPQTKKFIQYCASTSNGDGMLIIQGGAWNWIDWGGNMDIKEGSANTICNAMYIVLLDAAINIANVLGQSADKTYYQGLQTRVKNNFNNYFWNNSSNAYRFHNYAGQQSATIDDRSNAWAVLAGMADDAKKPGVLNVLKTRHDASPYQEMYIEMAMLQLDGKASLDRMRNRYATMITNWSSTLWEEFPNNNSSSNHAWSAGPLYNLSALVLGVQPSTAGYSEFTFLPRASGLQQVSASIPTVKGTIQASFTDNGSTFTQNLTSPSNTIGVVGVPKLNRAAIEVRIGGVLVWQNGQIMGTVPGASFFSEDAQFIKFKVNPGSWNFASTTRI